MRSLRSLSIILALNLTACAQLKAPLHANASERTFNLPAAKDTPANDPTCGWVTVKAPEKEDGLYYCCAADGSKPRCREAMWH